LSVFTTVDILATLAASISVDVLVS
jgi:hypothetical protein